MMREHRRLAQLKKSRRYRLPSKLCLGNVDYLPREEYFRMDPSSKEGASNVIRTTNAHVRYVDLFPGDVFYFPNGMWHRVETLDWPPRRGGRRREKHRGKRKTSVRGRDDDDEVYSVSINFSMLGLRWADVVGDALKQILLQNRWLRGRVSRIYGASDLDEAGKRAWAEAKKTLGLTDLLSPASSFSLTHRDVVPNNLLLSDRDVFVDVGGAIASIMGDDDGRGSEKKEDESSSSSSGIPFRRGTHRYRRRPIPK